MLLAIDTSTRQIGIALFDGARILAESVWTSPYHHTAELAPAVAQALARAGGEPGHLEAVGVATGPGSFTALRIGLAFAKGLALAHATPLIGVPSLEITVAGQPPAELPLIAILEAGRRRLAAGRFAWSDGRWQPEGACWLATGEALNLAIREPTLVCGELDAALRGLLAANPNARAATPAQCVRRPALLAELAWTLHRQGVRHDPATLAPVYLSEAQVS